MNRPAPAGTTPYRRIFVLVVALILYGSLYPWQFRARHLGTSPLWALLHTWPGGFDRYMLWDIAVNVALYVPFGVFGYLAMREKASTAIRIFTPLIFGLGLSMTVEMIQLFDVRRTCSLMDVTSDVAGAAIGIAAGALYRGKLQHLLEAEGPASLLRPSGALLLLACWLGYQIFPLFPAWGRTHLFGQIAAIGHLSSISPVDALVVFSEWLAVACLIESLLPHSAAIVPALALVVLPARLIIAGRGLVWADIAGATAACIAWLVLPRFYIRRATPVLLAGALVLAELSPFRFAHGGNFSWLPFRSLFRSNWQDGLVIMFRKSFWYGSVTWLWRTAGHRLLVTTGAVAAALLLLERLQVFLPGRTPEATDAVLAVIMGLLIWQLRDV